MKKEERRPDGTASGRHNGEIFSIYELLREGAENGVSARELSTVTGMTVRGVQRRVHKERIGGALICSDTKNGYYRARDASEVVRYLRSIRHRASEIFVLARVAEENLARLDGQELIGGW